MRKLFTTEDGQKVAVVGTAQRLDMPKFAVAPVSDGPLNAHAKFVGVWSSKRGWNGKGRYGMVIITDVSDTGLARGYYVWGPPVKGSWTQDAAGYRWFSEYIVNDKLTIKVKPEVEAKLHENVLTLSTTRLGKPTDKSSIELRPIWQLARASEKVEQSTRREQAPQRETTKTATAGSNPQGGALGAPGVFPAGGSCSRMRDVLGCNCALKTGGYIYPNPRSNNHTGYSFRWTNSSAYSMCLHAAGRR